MLDPYDPRMSLMLVRSEANAFNATQRLKQRIISRIQREIDAYHGRGLIDHVHGLERAKTIVEES